MIVQPERDEPGKSDGDELREAEGDRERPGDLGGRPLVPRSHHSTTRKSTPPMSSARAMGSDRVRQASGPPFS